jgi:hypothetical protein
MRMMEMTTFPQLGDMMLGLSLPLPKLVPGTPLLLQGTLGTDWQVDSNMMFSTFLTSRSLHFPCLFHLYAHTVTSRAMSCMFFDIDIWTQHLVLCPYSCPYWWWVIFIKWPQGLSLLYPCNSHTVLSWPIRQQVAGPAVGPIPMRTDLTPNLALCLIQNCVRKEGPKSGWGLIQKKFGSLVGSDVRSARVRIGK